jgi:AcrR family transcriptional regulator
MTDMIAPAPETRRRRKAERPKEILEAAFEEFSRNGYAAATLDQVAERAGVTKGTIYVYFESK